ncbi:glycoside hydrolase [Chitinimonas sp. BJB300]|uniref:glycoside hydrolase n=1 Tax=Chitinimonas sp. BJB300 TaxID=1559339 RepID=UPI000C0C619F|nr:glycoside hydrolase [Chitinimonas sp. BJB300]PHV11226.1 hypothetical protein CSQ89_12095 [Chitinimonas sp. BJB300]TSJ87385.1 hypothetical protein FG002_014215 [Chitinimonas sp. BJB300]
MLKLKQMTWLSTLLMATLHAEVVLENTQWKVSVDPTTLAMKVTAKGEEARLINTGVAAQPVTALTQNDQRASWKWPQHSWTLELEGTDLKVIATAQKAGKLTWLKQPDAAFGAGLIFPIGEGMYAARTNREWRQYLLNNISELDSSEQLSLPLWGLDQGNHTLNWLLINPFHNQLTFSPDGKEGIALTVSHQFSPLALKQPMQALLHLGKADPLAGAKRYREWLKKEDRFEPMADKLATQPDLRKLIGAGHVYLWGADLLSASDVTDWAGLAKQLRSNSALATALQSQISKEAKNLLADWPKQPDRYQKRVLLEEMNLGLLALARQRWQKDEMKVAAITPAYSDIREQVAQEFGTFLGKDPASWGSGVSQRTFASIQKAGLSRLWIGLDTWEGGLWHPEAIKTAVDAGYLIGPYDSYETALPLTKDPSWNTAHLGADVYQRCAIIKADGQPRAGFQKSGHYTNPECVRPLLTERITAIQKATNFNSWFLDAYAAGMVFDDFAPARKHDEAAVAEGYVANQRVVSQQMKIPLGSEGGNATTARGIAFAHGMQTPVFGWGDPAMYKDKKSPYFLGGYYPHEQPTIFFKPVPLKAPYRSVLFDPANRLPLYQAVFHDSIITTHHWGNDNLKFPEVTVERELLQQLYNVPPLLHLNVDTLAQRLPYLQQQERFFRPLHEQLATQALVGFRWLTPDKRVQEVTYADGTRLIANFTTRKFTVENDIVAPSSSIIALRPEQDVLRYSPTPQKPK